MNNSCDKIDGLTVIFQFCVFSVECQLPYGLLASILTAKSALKNSIWWPATVYIGLAFDKMYWRKSYFTENVESPTEPLPNVMQPTKNYTRWEIWSNTVYDVLTFQGKFTFQFHKTNTSATTCVQPEQRWEQMRETAEEDDGGMFLTTCWPCDPVDHVMKGMLLSFYEVWEHTHLQQNSPITVLIHRYILDESIFYEMKNEPKMVEPNRNSLFLLLPTCSFLLKIHSRKYRLCRNLLKTRSLLDRSLSGNNE